MMRVLRAPRAARREKGNERYERNRAIGLCSGGIGPSPRCQTYRRRAVSSS